MLLGFLVDVISVALLGSLTILVALRRPPQPLWPSFFLVVLALTIWAIGETFAQFLVRTAESHWIAVQVLYTGAIALPPAWFLFALSFAQHVGAPIRWDSPSIRRIPIALAAFYWIALVTNPWHGQFIQPNVSEPNEYHIVLYVHFLTSYAIFLGTFGIFLFLFSQVRATVLRKQIRLVVLGSAIPLLANFLFLSGSLPSTIDPTVATMALSATLFFAAIYRSRSFALTPFSLQHLLEFEDDVCLILDPAGQVVAYSQTATPFFGAASLHPNCDGLELLATTLSFPGRDAALDADEVRDRLFSHSLSTNVTRDDPSGERRDLRLTSTVVMSPSGKLRGVGVRLRDISVEARVRESQRLESLGVLAGGIAHDFNNLLTVISGHAELMLTKTEAGEPTHKSSVTIREAARQAAELTDQMLTYAGRGQVQGRPLAMKELVGDTVGVVKHGISKNTNVSVDVVDEPLVFGDSSQLRQVLMNLVQNAAEAIEDGKGQVQVTVRSAFLAGDDLDFVGGEQPKSGRYAVVDVTDDGSGINPENLPRIFDPFYTTKFTGRGLGLAAVLGIIRSHQGALQVRSLGGKGSTFSVFLPWPEDLRPEEEPEVPAPTPVQQESGTTVLVADDEPMVLELIEATLEELGFSVRTATGGREAIEVFERTHREIDVVLLDLTMPEVGGEEVLARIKTIDPAQAVIVMSGFAESHVTKRLAGLGAASILRKPFESAEIAEALSSIESSASIAAK